ncbi:DUF4838 domain-containing protein [Deminuibacter soli]|uniref:DUF4838 domain-containing protein n=1 Tax=Deminuibacter soli TaxID=2291815 RepID=A0A3E1NLN7_9BACT|nr:DUF4838 domain-containing protein [Deminuibacter soli]RFM28849.1 DUF4838 domain-containing protein [Deminuibacter soli]
MLRNLMRGIVLLLGVLTTNACHSLPGAITLASGGKSSMSIILPQEATKADKHAAEVLQTYLQQISGARLPVVSETNFKGSQAVYIGKCAASKNIAPGITGEGFAVVTNASGVFIKGASGKAVVYGVYHLLDEYFGCKKYSAATAQVPKQSALTLPAGLQDVQQPAMVYRQTYYPPSNNAEYLEWHRLHQFEDLWGLWGHSFYKLVPPAEYFKSHPEYFSLVNGHRQASQLCLSNEQVYNIAVQNLKKRFADNPDALYWSVSINDDLGYCTCDQCAKTDAEEGGPQGSLIRFVNRIAKTFPGKQFTTLAYLYASHPPKQTKPAPNVYIMLSNIDAYRDKPLRQAPSAAGFRNDLKGWAALTKNIFIWDYTTQFTNYLAPFPDIDLLQNNMQYFRENNVQGVFAQGSGDTYSDMAELASYLQAKLLWNAQADATAVIRNFCDGYYGPAGKYVYEYLQQLQQNRDAAAKPLDIYGNPVNDYNGYLSPAHIDSYSTLLDKAEAVVETDTALLNRVRNVRLSLEYTVLQQSRFFGIDKFGYLQPDDKAGYAVRPNWPARVKRFAEQAKKAGVTELAEGGVNPDAYAAEWQTIFAKGYTPNLALHATVQLANAFAPEYPAKKEQTLVDGVTGYNDFSYNWLCFYGTDLIATLDLGKAINCKSISMHFLDDPRHWIFLPSAIRIETSADGVHFKQAGQLTNTDAVTEEHYNVSIRNNSLQLPSPVNARYIRVSAINQSVLPAWRFRANRKSMLCCDEIYVN